MIEKDEQIAGLLHNLTNHPPKNDETVQKFESVRVLAKELGIEIIDSAPSSREQSLALTHLEQTVMWAVAAIARHQE